MMTKIQFVLLRLSLSHRKSCTEKMYVREFVRTGNVRSGKCLTPDSARLI